MTPAARYINTVFGTLDPNIRTHAVRFFQNKNDGEADQLLDALHPIIYSKSQTRYRFPHEVKQNQVIKTIFDAALTKAPKQVLQAAGNSTYPLWKRIIWITTPRMLSAFFGNKVVKVILSSAVMYGSIRAGYKSYQATTYFLTARAVPFVINHTHLRIIRLFNSTMDLIEAFTSRPWRTLIYTYFARRVILAGPEIPYLTSFARVVNPWGIFKAIRRSPQTIGWFLFNAACNATIFGWDRSEDISLFLRDLGEKSEAEKLSSSKQHAYALWTQSLKSEGFV